MLIFKTHSTDHTDLIAMSFLNLRNYINGSSCCDSAGYEPNQYPWRCRFDPWPCSVGEGSRVAVSSGVGGGWSSDPPLLWLWCRLAAAALIQPLAWEVPHAADVTIKRKEKRRFSPQHLTWAFMVECLGVMNPTTFLFDPQIHFQFSFCCHK